MGRQLSMDVTTHHTYLLLIVGVAEGFEKVALSMLSKLGDTHAQIIDDAQLALPQVARSRSITVTEPDAPTHDQRESRRCAC